MQKANDARKKSEEEIEAADEGFAEATVGRDRARDALKEAEQAAAPLTALEKNHVEAGSALEARKQLVSVEVKLEAARAGQEKAAARVVSQERDRDVARERREEMEAAFYRAQAAHLAASLVDGEPCPVCGSAEHPRPAVPGANVPSEDQVEATRREEEQAARRLKELEEELGEARVEVGRKESERTTLRDRLGEDADAAPETLWQRLANLAEAQKEAAGAADRLGELRKALEDVEAKQLEAETARERAKDGLSDAKGEMKAAQEQLEAAEGELPQELRAPDAVEAALETTRATAAALKKSLENARIAANNAATAFAEARERANGAADQSRRTAGEAAELAQRFRKRLAEADFADEADFRAARRSGAIQDLLDNAIKDHEVALAAATNWLERATTEAEGLEPPNLPTLEATAASARQTCDGIVAERARRDERLQGLEGTLTELTRLTEYVTREEARHVVFGRLAEVAGGTRDTGLAFERYVLAALLDDVLVAASGRLHRMSDSRYTLQRDAERGDRRKAAGLDLTVLDSHTGQERPVCTLSGGEGFLASLALALGLSDVVQAEAGGIRLDAIFIDEGFGSLDPEALDLALRVLQDLQSDGRLVGVISHVGEMESVIDARLEVLADRSGSRTQFVL